MTRILVIDDDSLTRKHLRQLLAHAGYDVLVASDGGEALKLLEKQTCDLVITDIYMPGKDGLSTLLELKKSRPGLQVIAISAGSPGVPIDLLPAIQHLGAVKTLKKPIQPEELLAAVTETLQARTTRRT